MNGIDLHKSRRSTVSHHAIGCLLSAFVVAGVVALPERCEAQFPPEVTEAQIVASQIALEPIAPQDLVDQVEADLTAIRNAFPVVAGIRASDYLRPGYLAIVAGDENGATLEEGVTAAMALAGSSYIYGWSQRYGGWVEFEFFEPYIPRIIGPEFEALDGVLSWYGYPGSDGDDIQALKLGNYVFEFGWGDCPSGCFDKHYWEFLIGPGGPELVREWGSVPTRASSTGQLKAKYTRH
jgi:hypothetical protein